MSENLLDEYVKITKTIDNIKIKLAKYKDYTENSIEKARTEEEQQNKINKFRNTIIKIKNDETINNKFKLLKKKQQEIKKQLIPENDINNTIIMLINKYSNDF